MKNVPRVAGGLGVVLTMSCVGFDGEAPPRIAMPANEWGIVSLAVDHSEADRTFELRGLDANDQVIADVALRIGKIADLDAYLPSSNELGNLGSELILTWQGVEDRRVSRETEQFFLRADMAPLQKFLRVPAVTAALARAHIIVTSPGTLTTTERPYGTLGWGPGSGPGCDAGMLNTSPLAEQCCWDNAYNNTYCDIYDCYFEQYNATMVFKNPSGNSVTRTYNTNGYGGCRASDGISSCSGSSCYYGPNGFNRASVGSVITYVGVVMNPLPNGIAYSYSCDPGGSNGHLSNVTGTQPTGAGCCVNGSGPCADASSCAACGGGGAAGRGGWDY